MIVREIDDLSPIVTAEETNWWDRFFINIGIKPDVEEEQKPVNTSSGSIDTTTLAIIAVVGVVLFMLMRK